MSWTIIRGDARSIPLGDSSVDLIVTCIAIVNYYCRLAQWRIGESGDFERFIHGQRPEPQLEGQGRLALSEVSPQGKA